MISSLVKKLPVVIVFLLISCADNNLRTLSLNKSILTFGDSLTAGVGAAEYEAYPAQLEKLIGFKVINAGISGETTQEGLTRLAAVLDQHNPQLVVLLEGGNDILRNYNLVQTKQNLAQMIEEIQSRNIQLILLGVPEKNIFSDSAPLYRELAEQYHLVFDGEIISDLIKNKKYKSDSVHFNGLGYQKLAQRIAEILEDNGALE
ncbi:arylesterase [Kangiella sp. TOML190]|uniref:arylesterase n=1 Tax=Kangiella sp. TOML190 TaxID=2931351 RepID=UPI00203F92D0|nr:arylesterase [Kangiella sp. TOML190]